MINYCALFYAGDMKDILTNDFIAEHGRPDCPNKITWKTRKSLRSEVPDGQEI